VRIPTRAATLVCGLWSLTAVVSADEGMWTFDNPPAKRLQEVYGFTPTPQWLDRVRLAAVRFNDGGSGSFVSADGLMITNHHVGLGCVQNLSTREHDYVAEGYLAPSRDKEPACPGYEVNLLMKTEDVTARVTGSVKAGMTDKQAADARKAEIARIENDCNQKTGLRCDVIDLYHGGEYSLYHYKKYTDVRLVFAPEQQAAAFGGDPDNFTFPRYDLDVCFFRAYENGQPVKPASYLRWSTKGAGDGDLVFVAGNPGSTSRLETMAQLEAQRDAILPETLSQVKRRLKVLRDYSAKSEENARRAWTSIFGLENALKAFTGELEALKDAKAMAAKAAEEKELREKVRANPELAKTAGDAFETIAAAEKKAQPRRGEFRYVGFAGSRLLGIAGQIVRYVVETKKPNEVRYPEYVDSSLASLENRLYSRAPIYDDLEVATLTDQLAGAQETLGPSHPFVQAALGGRSPGQVAQEAVSGTRLKDPDVRKALVKGGEAAVASSTDPMIVLARKIDPLAREVRKFEEDEVEAALTRAGERIAQARFKIYGKTVSPDATFTLRLSYGTVKGYPAEGTLVPARTTFYGLYGRAAAFNNTMPWKLSPRFEQRRGEVNLTTPLNFVSTADIIGGNSGSPTINRDGEFVGIIFDGNIESLALDYFYTEEKARAISVDARGILEALRKVYGASSVADELTGAVPVSTR
jgi:peptidase S46-like protein